MALKNFQASKGNVRFLETAHGKAMTALVQGHTLDVKLGAAIIAVSAGYVYMSKVRGRFPLLVLSTETTLACRPVWCPRYCSSYESGSAWATLPFRNRSDCEK